MNNYQYTSGNYELYEIEDSDGPSTSRTLRNRSSSQKDSMAERRVKQLVIDSKLSGFNPEKSAREKRKVNRKSYAATMNQRTASMYDERGRLRGSGIDLCDCLIKECPGCHFPCQTCKSEKCGSFCRVYRKWTWDYIEHDGKDVVITNKVINDK